MDIINKDILRPIGTIIISLVGLVSILVSFNKIFIALVFGVLIIDSISAIKNTKMFKK